MFGSRWRASLILTAVAALFLALLVAPNEAAGSQTAGAGRFEAKGTPSIAGRTNGEVVDEPNGPD